ncbi:hypothetical protein [Clostridium sp. CCUG 7971]|uniref:hypothetical protein n=1 Tax=Clostridium sp. CCUG 7971 TaxID=2811414 RepID=UPI001ABA77EA|nr:hypothetical protein [Clostridium sp. CCUG 7971]MBO3443395.1 hypothetical protein [Clostridium sp. CCUG 7971]
MTNILVSIAISVFISCIVSYLLLKKYIDIVDKITTDHLSEIKEITIKTIYMFL